MTTTMEFAGGPLDGTVVVTATQPVERFVVAGGLYILMGPRDDAAHPVQEFTWWPNKTRSPAEE